MTFDGVPDWAPTGFEEILRDSKWPWRYDGKLIPNSRVTRPTCSPRRGSSMARKARIPVSLIVFAALMIFALPVKSVEVVFDIDPERSFLVSNAFIKAVEAPTTPQDEGADTSTYSGTITVDLDDLDAPSELTFLSAEAIAGDSGAWLPTEGGGAEGDPGDPSPANFGIVLDAGPVGVLLGAFRETIFTIESEDLAVQDGVFDSGQSFVTTQGFLDSNIISPILGNSFDRDDTTGDNTINVSEEPGSYVLGVDGVATLSIPVDLDFLSDSEDGVDFFFDGMLVATFGTPMLLPGDANADGRVDAADLNVIGLNWQQTGKTRAEGDFTGDGLVDAADLNVLGLNWQSGVEAAAVPEPSALMLLAAAMLTFVVMRR